MSCDSDSTTPPIAIIGAVMTMVIIMISTCWTCVVSLVVRVISDAVLNRSNWCTERVRDAIEDPIAHVAAEAARDLCDEK